MQGGVNVSEFLQPIEMTTIYWLYCKVNQGIMEYWSSVKDKKDKILLNPIFHNSNIPIGAKPLSSYKEEEVICLRRRCLYAWMALKTL